MAIVLTCNFNEKEDANAFESFAEDMHNQLCGWKPYIDNEVLLNFDKEKLSLNLIVGPRDDGNVYITVDNFKI